MLLLLQTLEFWILPFPYNVIQCFISRPNIGLSAFGQFFQTSEFNGLLFPNITWNSGFWLLKKIEIQCSAFCKHWNSRILLFEKLHFSVFAYPNIGIWILEFSTLEFSVLAFPNIGIVNFGFSKHWNSGFWRSQHWNSVFWHFARNLREFGVARSGELEVNQWIVQDIHWLSSQSERAKNTIHCFSIY